VKHLAIPARSVHSQRPYTTPGLGDRIHSAIIGWAYGQAHQTPVTLHLTADKWTGGQFENKPESWDEIVSLFPQGAVAVKAHPVSPESETAWIVYLKSQGYDAQGYVYGDYLGAFECAQALDIAPYLKLIQRLSAPAVDIDLPERFITVQWDSNARSRTLSQEERDSILECYRAEGLRTIVVGGEARDSFRWPLQNIAYAMSHATYHVGVDSAFLHMAQLYMPWHQIHLYGDLKSHHAKRARDNGAVINLHR
jgi:hypothetical protein